MWNPFRKVERREPEYFHSDYPPIDAEEGDYWWPPMYPAGDYTLVGDMYIYRNGGWVCQSKNICS